MRGSGFKIVGLVVVAGCALTACASPTWTKLGAGEQDIITDQYYCERDVRQSNFGEKPENPAAQAAGGWTAAGDSIGRGISALGAAIEQKQFYNRCMIAHGWREQAEVAAQSPPVLVASRPPRAPTMLPTEAGDAPVLSPCAKQDREIARMATEQGFQYHSSCK